MRYARSTSLFHGNAYAPVLSLPIRPFFYFVLDAVRKQGISSPAESPVKKKEPPISPKAPKRYRCRDQKRTVTSWPSSTRFVAVIFRSVRPL